MTLAQKAIEQTNPRGPFIKTLSGAEFFIDEVNIQDIPLDDIAHAMSMNVRFNGHIARPYSVLEHSLNVSYMAQALDNCRETRLWGLLHDVSEAFVPDIPRPFKHLLGGFEEFEDRIGEALAAFYDLPWPMPDQVHYVDRHIVGIEAMSLFPNPPKWASVYDDLSVLAAEAEVDPRFFGKLDRQELVNVWIEEVGRLR